MEQRPASPTELGELGDRPESFEELLAAFDEHSAALRVALEQADPAETAWTWSTEQTVGFTFRRQAHEAMIHRLDAELTAGVEPAPLDPALSADGVHELLDVMYGGCPPWGTFTGGRELLKVALSDTGDAFWIQLGRFTGTDPSSEKTYDELDLSVVEAPAGDQEPAVQITGTAADLDIWLWKRRRDDSVVEVQGDRDVYDRFRSIVDNPLT